MLQVTDSAFHKSSFLVTLKEGELHTYRTVSWFMLKNSKWLEDYFSRYNQEHNIQYASSSPKNKFKPKCILGASVHVAAHAYIKMVTSRWGGTPLVPHAMFFFNV
jgi:hypothetical protein